MLKIYTAPITNPGLRTLQADGATWEELALELKNQGRKRTLEILVRELPSTFERSDVIRLTFSDRVALQLLREAGVSV